MDKKLENRVSVLEEKVKSQRREIKTQAKEYQRRLLELNHAHDKQVQDQQTYVSEDKFTGWQGEMNSWRNNVSSELSKLQGREGGVGSTRGLVLQAIPIIIALAVAIVALFKK